MVFLSEFVLPFKDPVLVFALMLIITLLAPMVFSRLRMPGIVGLLLAGVLVGPHGVGLLERDISIELFGTVGLMYIMFVAGLEIDINDFRKTQTRSLRFGTLSFLLPQVLTTLGARLVLHFEWPAAVLFGSLVASHTLLAYPIASRLGITKNEAVTVTVGGTIIADTLALLVLAVVAGAAQGEIGIGFWVTLVISLSVFVFLIMWGIPKLGRWFFKNIESEGVSQYIFVMALTFLAGYLAHLAGVEPIIGAFLAGLAVNRLIPASSPLMNRIEFVGNAIFIPFFLISVGMLVDISTLFAGLEVWLIAGLLIVLGVIGKYGAAFLIQKWFGYTVAERHVMFALSSARAAATLAAVLRGYELDILSENVFNGTVLMILASTLISSFTMESAGRKLAVEIADSPSTTESPDRILVPISNPNTVENLMDLAMMIKAPDSDVPIMPLSVVRDADDAEEKIQENNKMLQKAVHHGSAAEKNVQVVSRIDLNITSGIVRAIRELGITEVIIGWNGKVTARERIFGTVLDNLLASTRQMLLVSHVTHPLNTMETIVVVVPPNAELEKGFGRWLRTIHILARQIGTPVQFWGETETLQAIREPLGKMKPNIEAKMQPFNEWAKFPRFARRITTDDLFIVISARQGTISHNNFVDRIPRQLSRFFEDNNFVIIYPEQASQFQSEEQLHLHQLRHTISENEDEQREYENRSVVQPGETRSEV
ncbi:Kef-type K+ transport system, membrane component KefB [Catalinimonas alkaloidigena]|uniref:Kef-type K+ transport system, membrane component KefB n=1 Tax=Catalinimonas alkaloidigena TaxID=1075417 RepID=A0A1G9PA02_9BACT|nr:cation:proton antiporter [Catalinimonas alkaloidigena]SDL95027.1 Kef-type K+ transport system, membrane component KefB [Catalinimonas alkaloidigena]